MTAKVLLLLPIPIENDLLLNNLNQSMKLINEFTPSFQYIYPYYIKYIIHNYNNKKQYKKISKSFNSIGIPTFITLIHHNMIQIRYNVIEIVNKEIEKLCEIMNEIEVDLLNHIVYCIIIEMDINIYTLLFELFNKLLKYSENKKMKISILECLIEELYYYINYKYDIVFDKCFIQIPILPSTDDNNIEWYYIGNKINSKDNIQKYSRLLSVLTCIYSDKMTIYNDFLMNMLNEGNYYIIYIVILSFLMINDCNEIPFSFLKVLMKYENYELSLPLFDSDVITEIKSDVKEIERFKKEKIFPISIKESDNYIELIENINTFCDNFENNFNKWKCNKNIKKELSIILSISFYIVLIHSSTIQDLKITLENHMKDLHNEMTLSSVRIKVIISLICLKREIEIQQNIKEYYLTIFEYIIYENYQVNYSNEYTTKIIELLGSNKYIKANEQLIRNMIFIVCNYNYEEYKCIIIKVFII